MRNELIASFFVVAVLAGAGAGYLVGIANIRSTQLVQSIVVYPRTFTSTSCAYTTMPAALECPHFWNVTWTLSIEYAGPWIASYQSYLGEINKSNLAEAGSFYGHGIGNHSLTITGWTQGQQITACVQAQKLDASGATLVLRIVSSNVMNETSSGYGKTSFCIADAIV